MSRRLRKACKQVIEISKQEGMNFSELQEFMRDLNNELKEQKWEECVNRSEEEKAFKRKADQFFELSNYKNKSRPSVRNNYNVKYAELLCVYFTYRKEISSEKELLMKTALRFQIQTSTMKQYVPYLKKILIEFFQKVPGIYEFGTLELIEYTVRYIEDYF